MLGPFDNGILNILMKLVKECAVTGNTHYKSLVFFGFVLSFFQYIRGNNIELYMPAPELDVADNQLCKLFHTFRCR